MLDGRVERTALGAEDDLDLLHVRRVVRPRAQAAALDDGGQVGSDLGSIGRRELVAMRSSSNIRIGGTCMIGGDARRLGAPPGASLGAGREAKARSMGSPASGRE